MFKLRTAIAAATLIAASTSASAGVTVFSDQALWSAATAGTVITEDFADAALVTGLSFAAIGHHASIAGGAFMDRLAPAKIPRSATARRCRRSAVTLT